MTISKTLRYVQEVESDSMIWIWFQSYLCVLTYFNNEFKSLVQAFLWLHGSQMAPLLGTDLVMWPSDKEGAIFAILHVHAVLGRFLQCIYPLCHRHRAGGCHGKQDINGRRVCQCLVSAWTLQSTRSWVCVISFRVRVLELFILDNLREPAFVIYLLPSTLEIFSQLLPHNGGKYMQKVASKVVNIKLSNKLKSKVIL